MSEDRPSRGGRPSRRGRYRRLVAGRHGLAPSVVAEDQRWRLLRAAGELFAERGYAELNSRLIARRARVSAATFYANFSDLDACLAAAGSLAAEALEELSSEHPGGGEEAAAAVVEQALDLFAAEPGAARLLGPEGAAIDPLRRRLQLLLDRLASRLARLRGDQSGIASERILVGGALNLVATARLNSQAAAELGQLLLLWA